LEAGVKLFSSRLAYYAGKKWDLPNEGILSSLKLLIFLVKTLISLIDRHFLLNYGVIVKLEAMSIVMKLLRNLIRRK
jgi:hypothetical protein